MSAGKEEGRLGPCRITVLPDEKVGEAGRERGAYQRVILKRWVLFLNPKDLFIVLGSQLNRP